jgi:glycosyltransferase involved in cell wall biosynthesis
VSIVIPTYNRAAEVQRAIQSVRAQTFTDYELIVVDDGSTDGTEKVLSALQCPLKYIRQENRGVSVARNRGIAESTSPLIAFLDSDDAWLPEKLARQTASWDPDDPHFVIHTDEIWLRNGARVNQRSKHRKQGGRFFERALERCLISPSSVLISRTLLDETGWFDEDLPAAEDYDLWLRMTAFHTVTYIDEALVVKHGGHDDQLSRNTPAIDRFRIVAIEKILKQPRLPSPYRRAAVAELVRKCHIVAAGCQKRGKNEEARYYRELARAYNPERSCAPGY